MQDLKLLKMSDIQPEPIEWLWEPYIPLGAITLIQGDGGEGKTTTALAIAAAVTTGEALPGSSGTSPANVIIQNAEDSYARTVKPRLELFGADCDRIIAIDEDEAALTLDDDRIEGAIIRTGAKLIVIDPVQAYLGKANMNSAGGVRPLMKRLGAVAARTGSAVLLVGHLHKGGGKAQYRGLGSIDIFAAARSVLTVGRIPVDEDMRAIVNNKNNLSPAGTSQAFGLDSSGRFSWLGDYDISVDEVLNGVRPPESQFAKARRLIEAALRNGPIPAADMMQRAEEQGISPKTLNRAKEVLGVISAKRGARWYWELPVDVDFEVVQDSQHGQDSHEKSVTTMTSLAILPREVV